MPKMLVRMDYPDPNQTESVPELRVRPMGPRTSIGVPELQRLSELQSEEGDQQCLNARNAAINGQTKRKSARSARHADGTERPHLHLRSNPHLSP